MEGKSAEPSRPIIYKPFGFLKSIDLSTVGLKLEDIPYKFGWDLVLIGESDVCQRSGEKQNLLGSLVVKLGLKTSSFCLNMAWVTLILSGCFQNRKQLSLIHI